MAMGRTARRRRAHDGAEEEELTAMLREFGEEPSAGPIAAS